MPLGHDWSRMSGYKFEGKRKGLKNKQDLVSTQKPELDIHLSSNKLINSREASLISRGLVPAGNCRNFFYPVWFKVQRGAALNYSADKKNGYLKTCVS